MSTFARRRIVADVSKVMRDPPVGMRVLPFEDNIMFTHAVIGGPPDTPWETGTFHIIIRFSEEYPTKPPMLQFLSPVYHPNVYLDGRICIDILQKEWSPMYDVAAVLMSIQSLLDDPNPDSPANTEAAKLYLEDRDAYVARVLRCVEDSWKLPSIDPKYQIFRKPSLIG